jgi:N-acetylglucosamine-6-phosphate deacetylase
MRIRARHYATGQRVGVDCDHGRIVAVGPPTGDSPDREDRWVAPSFFDLQINGCHQHAFSSERLTIASIRRVIEVCRRHGIGGFCPTLVTNSFAAILHGFTTLREACENDPEIAHAMPVFHLEGPYISGEDGPRGAHARQHVRRPDWDEFRRWQDAAGGRIRLVTLAPEQEGAIAFIEKLTAGGVVVSLGHTAASGPCVRDAIRAGARLSTHLGNGSHAVLPRHENYIWEQLAADELWASLICDGHHLPPSVVKCMIRMKTPARVILTCDASTLAGLPPGRYREWDQEFEVLAQGKVVVPGTSYLAGSWAFTDTCAGNAMRFAGVSLREAIDMASARPRELLDLPARALEPGLPADLMLFDWEAGGPIRVVQTLTSVGS